MEQVQGGAGQDGEDEGPGDGREGDAQGAHHSREGDAQGRGTSPPPPRARSDPGERRDQRARRPAARASRPSTAKALARTAKGRARKRLTATTAAPDGSGQGQDEQGAVGDGAEVAQTDRYPQQEERKHLRTDLGVAQQAVALQVTPVREEPVLGAEAVEVLPAVAGQLMGQGYGLVPVGAQVGLQLRLGPHRVGHTVAQVGHRHQAHQEGPGQQMAPVAQVVAEVDQEQGQPGHGRDGLAVGVGVEGHPGGEDGRVQVPRRAQPVAQVAEQEDGAGGGRHHRLEGRPREVEPSRRGGQEEGRRPPPAGAERIAQGQGEGHRPQHGEEGGRPPRHLHRLAQEGHREEVEVDRQERGVVNMLTWKYTGSRKPFSPRRPLPRSCSASTGR